MSSFHYKGKFDETLNGVKCDDCGFKLYTDTTGFEFGEHIRKAKANGWLITKKCDKWINLCPKCREKVNKKDFADFILHWLADMYGCPCEYDYAGINTANYLYEHDNDFCEEGCGTHTDYDCWKKFLELKYQESQKEGNGA